MTDKKSKEIGKRIKKYRLKARLSQVGLAERAGIQANTIARLERGEHRAGVLSLEKLAKVFGVKVSDILGN